jgi:tetratricopeptide (TPR) repeat protein
VSAAGASEAAFARARAGDLPGAVASLRERVVTDPDDGEAWMTLGMLLAGADDAAEAVRALTRAVALDAGAVLGRVLLARALERAGRLDDAESELVLARALAPAHPGIARELGSLAYARGRHDDALAHLATAASLAPPPEEAARISFARGLVHEARRDVGAAIASYRDALHVDPAHEAAWRTLADALAQVGEHSGAIEALDALLALRPRDEGALHNRSVLEAALAAMQARRLLGAAPSALDASAVVEGGAMHRTAALDGELRYEGTLASLHVTVDAEGRVASLFFAVDDAPGADASRFGVTVVGLAGAQGDTSYATAATLTFLREAIGVPMTEAAHLLARLLDAAAPIRMGAAEASFTSVGPRHGIRVSHAA